jgi:hypothetical protein
VFVVGANAGCQKHLGGVVVFVKKRQSRDAMHRCKRLSCRIDNRRSVLCKPLRILPETFCVAWTGALFIVRLFSHKVCTDTELSLLRAHEVIFFVTLNQRHSTLSLPPMHWS